MERQFDNLRIYEDGSAAREWEMEQSADRRAAALENSGEYAALSADEIEERDREWQERRSIWDSYRERFDSENTVEIREFARRPAGMQGRLFGEVA